LALGAIKLPLLDVVAAVEAVVVVPVELDVPVVATVEAAGEPSLGDTMGDTALVAVAADEVLGSEPPHAASVQSNAPKALPRIKLFISNPRECNLLWPQVLWRWP
jgi:hypothetical protein